MAESVVHHLQIVQIDDEQSPITRSAAVERAQRGVERRAIGKRSQRVSKGALPMHPHPAFAIERDRAKMHALAHNLSFRLGRSPAFAIVECKGPDGFTGRVENRARPARSEEHTSELQSLMRNSYA